MIPGSEDNTGSWLPDAFAFGLFLLFILFFLVTCNGLVFRRFFWIMGSIYFMRGFTVWATRYPKVPFPGDNTHPASVFLGAMSVVFGFSHTATDLMFSGHTALMVTIAMFFTYYRREVSTFIWMAVFLGIIMILATRHHYTADILVAIFISAPHFIMYHLLFEPEFMLSFSPHLRLHFPHPSKSGRGGTITLPATLVDAKGRKTHLGSTNRTTNINVWSGITRTRYYFFRGLVWLDGK